MQQAQPLFPASSSSVSPSEGVDTSAEKANADNTRTKKNTLVRERIMLDFSMAVRIVPGSWCRWCD
jgi:hypothetical protein